MALAAWRASPWTGSLVRQGFRARRSRWAVRKQGSCGCSSSPLCRKHLLDRPGLRCHRGGQAERVFPLRGHLTGAGQATGHHGPSREGVRQCTKPGGEGHQLGVGKYWRPPAPSQQSHAVCMQWRRTRRSLATPRDRPLVSKPAGFNCPFADGLSFLGAPHDLWVPAPHKIQLEPPQTSSSFGQSHRERRVVWIWGRMENSTLHCWHMGWFLGCIQLQCSAPVSSCRVVCKHTAARRLADHQGSGMRPQCGGMRGRGVCPLLQRPKGPRMLLLASPVVTTVPAVPCRYLFWTEWGQYPRIERSRLDGTERMVLVNVSISWPNGISVDYEVQPPAGRTVPPWGLAGSMPVPRVTAAVPLRWGLWGHSCPSQDAGVSSPVQGGLSRVVVLGTLGPSARHGGRCGGCLSATLVHCSIADWDAFSLPQDGKLYWCDARTDKIERIDLETGENREVVLSSNNMDMFSVSVFEEYIYWSDRYGAREVWWCWGCPRHRLWGGVGGPGRCYREGGGAGPCRRVLLGWAPHQLLSDCPFLGLMRMAPSKEATRTMPLSRCPCGQGLACSSRTSKSSTGPGRRVRPGAGCQPLVQCCRAPMDAQAGLPQQADAGRGMETNGPLCPRQRTMLCRGLSPFLHPLPLGAGRDEKRPSGSIPLYRACPVPRTIPPFPPQAPTSVPRATGAVSSSACSGAAGRGRAPAPMACCLRMG